MNIDGAFCSEKRCGGIGVIVRDENGVGVAALARQFVHAHSVFHMELEACIAGMQLGMCQGWSNLDLESDSILLIAALKRVGTDLSDVGCVLEDCKTFMSIF